MQREQRILEEILGSGGLLAKVIDGYEPRPQQLEMGLRLLEALFRERMLIVEAPTGVGKTMAYLVPAALFARARREPVIVSSHTRHLQDQILIHEAPRLRRLVHPDLRVVVLKGRSNYLCRRRWELFVEEKGSGVDGRWAVERLEGWARNTETGAFAEAPDLGPRGARVWAEIGGDARFCRSRLCRADTGCFHKRARREAREAQIVVVNHSLLLADVFGGGGVLPEHRVAIIDEAHELPEVALEPLSRNISARSFEEHLLRLGGAGEPGVSDRLRRATRTVRSQVTRRNLTGRINEFEQEARGVLAQARAFFAAVRAGTDFPPEGERRRYDRRACEAGLFPAEGEQLVQAVRRAVEQGTRLHAAVAAELSEGSTSEELADTLEAVEAVLDELSEQAEALAGLLAPADGDSVYVLEASTTRGPQLSSIPLETGPPLRAHLLDAHDAVVFTSATLAAGDAFDYYERQVGLERGEAGHLQLSSPFDFERQLLTLVATHAVDPRHPGYEGFLAQAIASLLAAVNRKTLVLFTSHRTLRSVWEALARREELAGLEILGQSRDAPRAQLIARFREAERAVLLGTASFWQGVDFPGRELEMLIVTRLPFPVPTDPRVEAISERLAEEGRPGFFSEIALPGAVLTMRQGVGRLIRRQGDRGVCVVLDPRMMRATYGGVFCAALPSPPQAVRDEAELVQRARDWFALGGSS